MPDVPGVTLLYEKPDLGAILGSIVIVLLLLVMLYCIIAMIRIKDSEGWLAIAAFVVLCTLYGIFVLPEAFKPIYVVDISKEAKYVDIYENFKDVTRVEFYWEVKAR